MKKTKRYFFLFFSVLALALLAATSAFAGGPRPKKVTKITASQKTIYVGDEFELRAVMSPYYAEDDYLRWSIVGTKGILRFDDDDRDGDEMEFVALKAGTTKVRCSVVGKSSKYSKTFTVTVKEPTYKISRVGQKKVTVAVGDDVDLEVRVAGKLSSRYLKWTIKDTSILRFEDNDRYGDDVEVEGLRPGKTTVTCKNLKTKKSVSFIVMIVDGY
ncbi:MAG: hypothetical protein Q4F41_07510 [Eubacteriales bacterium]|nr:hypothetical protein [Eubacteriales bacterium]